MIKEVEEEQYYEEEKKEPRHEKQSANKPTFTNVRTDFWQKN